MVRPKTPQTINHSVQFHIRSAQLEDLNSILDLLMLKADFDGCSDALTATAEKLQIDLFGEHPLAAVLLAEVEQKAVGFASYHRIYSTFLAKPGIWLDDLFVKPEFRGQNIGCMLMAQLCRIAQETDCARIDWTVATNNTLGIDFYERIGATVRQKVRACRLDQEAIAQHAQFQFP